MNLSIDENMVREVVAAAIMNSFSADQRETLIKSAIQHLITPPPPTGHYGAKQPSPIERAFQIAVEAQAQKIARDLLTENAEVREQISLLITEAMVLLSTTKRTETVERIARAIGESLSGERS